MYVVAVGGAVRASSGVATLVSLICGDWHPKTSVSSHGPLSNIERGHQGWVLIAPSRSVVCAMPGGSGRLASCHGLSVSVCECDLPAESGELAGDRDRDDAIGLLAGVLERSPAGVQSSLRAPGDVDGLG